MTASIRAANAIEAALDRAIATPNGAPPTSAVRSEPRRSQRRWRRWWKTPSPDRAGSGSA